MQSAGKDSFLFEHTTAHQAEAPAPANDNSGLAQRILRRHAPFLRRVADSRVARAGAGLNQGRLPLLTAVQRRWLPTAALAVQRRAGLPYLPPYVFPGGRAVSTATVQRMADTTSPVGSSSQGRSAPAATASPKPQLAVVIAQRAAAHLSAPASSGEPVSAPGPPRLSGMSEQTVRRPITAVAQPGERTALTLAQRAELSAHAPVTGPATRAVQRSEQPAVTPPTVRPHDLGAAILKRHLAGPAVHIVPRMSPRPALFAPALQRGVAPFNPRHTAPALLVQRVTAIHGAEHQSNRFQPAAAPPVESQRHEGPAAQTARAAAGDAPQALASATNTTTLGTAILQRYIDLPTGQVRRQPTPLPGWASGTEDTPVVQLPSQAGRVRPGAAEAGSQAIAHPIPPFLAGATRSLAGATGAISATDSGRAQALQRQPGNSFAAMPLVAPASMAQLTPLQAQRELSTDPTAGMSTANGAAPTIPAAVVSESSAAAALDLDDVVEHVWRKLIRRLAVEGERRGRQSWP
jgi:hypothetical protein